MFVNFTICLILSLLNLVCCNVPVLLWESSKSNKITTFPAMYPITNSEFKQYMLKKLHGQKKSPLVAMFVGESLSHEDFREQDRQTVLPELKYITQHSPNTEFMASVHNPIGAIKELSMSGYPIHHVNIDKNDDIPDGCGKIIIVNLQEAKPDEGRTELLRRYDGKIAEIYSQLLSKCSHVIGVMTALQSSWVEAAEVIRMRRSVEDTQNGTEQFKVYQDEPKKYALMVTKSTPTLILRGEDISSSFDSIPNISGDKSKPSSIKLVLNLRGKNLQFNFENVTSGYWYLRSALIDVGDANESVTLTPTKEIYAPLNMSYHSGTPVTFKNETSTLTFNDLQVEPFFMNPGSEEFGDAVDEVTFFTPPIWSGIFVTFLLAIIFSWGISMIMDIRTMDQFDDPKGKTITVSATD